MKITQGARYMIWSGLSFTIMQLLIKQMPYEEIPTIEQTFFRSFISWLFSFGYVYRNKISFKVSHPKLILLRSCLGIISLFSLFYALPRMPLGTAITLRYLSPILTTVFSIWLLKERLSVQQWLYLMLAFVGVLLLKGFDPRVGIFEFSLSMIAAVASGLLYIVLRKIGEDDNPYIVVHYFMLIAAVISGIAAIPTWKNPHWQHLGVFLIVGYTGFLGQTYLTRSLQQADKVHYLVLFRYLEAVYALILGYLLFDESYPFWSFLGIVLIFSSLILSVQHNSAPSSFSNNSRNI